MLKRIVVLLTMAVMAAMMAAMALPALAVPHRTDTPATELMFIASCTVGTALRLSPYRAIRVTRQPMISSPSERNSPTVGPTKAALTFRANGPG
jgi:hypothetical protein